MLYSTTNAYGQHEYDYLLNKSYAERIPLFDTVTKPELDLLDSVSHHTEIDKIIALAEEHNDVGLVIEAKLARWYYIRSELKNQNHDFLISEVEQLLKEAQKHNQKEYEILIKFEIGCYMFNYVHDYNRAFSLHIENFNKLVNISEDNMPNKKAMVVNIANNYYNFGDYSSAKKYLFIANELKSAWRSRVNIQCKNTLGLIYRNEGNYDSAEFYFEQAIDIAKASGQDIWVAICTGNLGISYYMQRDYTRAIPLLKYDANACYDYGEYDNAIKSAEMLAKSYIKTNQISLAENELMRIWSYADSMKDKTKQLPALYEAMSDLYKSKGDYKQALLYSDSSNHYTAVVQERDNILQLARVQNRINQEVHDKEIQALSIEKKLITTTRNALVAGLILLSIITYLVINRQRIKHKAKQNKLLSEKQLAQANLDNATKELGSFTKSLQEKNALIEKSANEIEKLQSALNEKKKVQVDSDALQQIYSSTILTDDEWEEFKQLFDKVHTGFLVRLKNKMPDLSPADTRFIVLSKLNMSNKEMAGILGVQPDTIRSYKHRLRKKFDLTEDANIREFVDAI